MVVITLQGQALAPQPGASGISGTVCTSSLPGASCSSWLAGPRCSKYSSIAMVCVNRCKQDLFLNVAACVNCANQKRRACTSEASFFVRVCVKSQLYDEPCMLTNRHSSSLLDDRINILWIIHHLIICIQLH